MDCIIGGAIPAIRIYVREGLRGIMGTMPWREAVAILRETSARGSANGSRAGSPGQTAAALASARRV